MCSRALAAEPAARYAGAADLAADLEALARRRLGRAWYVAAAAVFLAALLALGWWWRRPADGRGGGAAPPPPGLSQRPADAVPLALRMRVWDRDHYVELPKAAPLRTGDAFQVVVEAPAALHVSLFLFTSEGRLQLLTAWEPASGEAERRFPASEDQAAPLKGAAGTEFLLACGRRSGPVGLDEVQSVWQAPGPWPALPGESVLRLAPEKVTVEQRGRDVGAPIDRPDPEAAVAEAWKSCAPGCGDASIASRGWRLLMRSELQAARR